MIRYTAHDQAYNRASCKFSIRVQGEAPLGLPAASPRFQAPHPTAGAVPHRPQRSPSLPLRSEALPHPEAAAERLHLLYLRRQQLWCHLRVPVRRGLRAPGDLPAGLPVHPAVDGLPTPLCT